MNPYEAPPLLSTPLASSQEAIADSSSDKTEPPAAAAALGASLGAIAGWGILSLADTSPRVWSSIALLAAGLFVGVAIYVIRKRY